VSVGTRQALRKFIVELCESEKKLYFDIRLYLIRFDVEVIIQPKLNIEQAYMVSSSAG